MGSRPGDYIKNLLRFTPNADFQRKIDSFSRLVSRGCSDLEAIKDAKELVPIAQIVQDNLEILEGDYQDNLLPHLVQWFSGEFFTWFNEPDCEKCNTHLYLGGRTINLEGNSVENYRCNNTSCDFAYDFIRHNDPAILIRTRRGRCGEWANCFLLFLRAFDYEARMVLDTTDHVWNEVWSQSQERWLHVDPCEGVVDTPLLYELGWKKKLEYCLAFGQYEALDVTRRYSSHFDATRSRRKACDEYWLQQYLDNLTDKLSKVLSDTMKDEVVKRRSIDMEHLDGIPTVPRSLPDDWKLKGRKTGSLSWRVARGEFNPTIQNLVVIKVSNNSDRVILEGGQALFELLYNSSRDSYKSSCQEYTKRGWSSLSYSSENLDYKYERDWKTSYVARYETCPCEKAGKIQWRFDLSTFDTWSRVEILVEGMIYPLTTIDLLLKCFNDKNNVHEAPTVEIKLSLNTINRIERDQLISDVCMMDLIVKLAGGEPGDEVAWQKPQLFRQVLGQNDNEWSLIIKVL